MMYLLLICILIIVIALHSVEIGAQASTARLIYEGRPNDYGVVEFFRYSRWVQVCADEWDDNDSQVVCRENGYLYGKALPGGFFGPLNFAVTEISRVNCNGSEREWAECDYSHDAGVLCSDPAMNYATAVCSNSSFSEGYRISVTGSNHNYTGRVRVKRYGVNGRVCNTHWDDKASLVVCRSLGFSGGVAYQLTQRGTFPIWIAKTLCHGNESHLSECNVTDAFHPHAQCSSSDNAGILCYHDNQGVQYRLTKDATADNNMTIYGRIEILYEGIWGTVCEDTIASADATARVMCRNLGYADGVQAIHASSGGTGPIWTRALKCSGYEDTILECPSGEWRRAGWQEEAENPCTHDMDVNVRCYPEVRLRVPGMERSIYRLSHGLVEIHNGDTWSQICDTDWDDADATVVCNQLGFPDGRALCCGAFGDGITSESTRQWTNVHCTGTEADLRNCSLRLATRECDIAHRAAVTCFNISGSGVQFSLSDIAKYKFTAVNAQVDNTADIGHICADGWTNTAATVMCAQYGYREGVALRFYTEPGDIQKPFLATKVVCSGQLFHMGGCNYRSSVKSCANNYFAGVSCTNYPGTGTSGIFLLSTASQAPFKKVWVDDGSGVHKAVCANSTAGWTDTHASILCKSKGFRHGGRAGRQYRTDAAPPSRYSFLCSGNESSLMDCLLTMPTVAPTCNMEATVHCFSQAHLIGGASDNFGVLLTSDFHQDSQGLVCDEHFGRNESTVACRDVGYEDGIAFCCSAFSDQSYGIMSGTFSCHGNERTLFNCSHSDDSGCSSGKYVSLYCSRSRMNNKLGDEVKLTGPSNTYNGYVNMKLSEDDWIGICHQGFDSIAATVTCQQLGFVGGYRYFGPSMADRGTVAVSRLVCKGTERSLSECQMGPLRLTTHPSCRDMASVLCYNVSGLGYRLGAAELPTYKEHYGEPEIGIGITDDQVWGKLCLSLGETKTSTVFCRGLGKGYTTGVTIDYVQIPYFLPSTISLESSLCKGTESSLSECRNSWFSVTSSFTTCSRAQFVVHCLKSNVRLTPDIHTSDSTVSNSTFGVVNIYKQGAWQGVCDDGWDQIDAGVVCRQLGYKTGVPMCCNVYRGVQPASFVLTNVSCTGKESDLTTCPYDAVSPDTRCSPAAVFCTNDTIGGFTIRLVHGTDYTGVVEVRFESGLPQGYICPDEWEDSEANVVCKRLNFTEGRALKRSIRGLNVGRVPMWLSKVNCRGNESALQDCSYIGPGEMHECSQKDYIAGVFCTNEKGIFYTLAGNQSNQGLVEVSVDGNVGTLCSQSPGQWTDQSASVFCRSYDSTFTDGVASYNSFYTGGTGPVWQAGFECLGDESSLHDCPQKGLLRMPDAPCANHQLDVGVLCFRQVRLRNSIGVFNTDAGRVEINRKGSWNAVCSSGFGNASARHICRELGFMDGKALCCSAHGVLPDIDILNKTLECQGTFGETLEGCITNTSCENDEYASVICTDGQPIEEYTVNVEDRRTIGDGADTGTTGFVTVSYMSVGGRVCTSTWTEANAQVVCASLGYTNGAVYNHSVPSATPRPVLASINCHGNESRLEECIITAPSENCPRNLQAGFLCFNDSSIEFKLLRHGGSSANEGIAEVTVGGITGYICGLLWDDNDADVFCKTVGYAGGQASTYHRFNAIIGSRFDVDKIWLSHLQCDGDENSILDCRHPGWDILTSATVGKEASTARNYCYRSYSPYLATCVCFDTVRLSSGPHGTMGRVEVSHEGNWVAVCDVGWTDQKADATCRQLGYSSGKAVLHSAFGTFDQTTLLTDFYCNTTDNGRLNCSYTAKECSSRNYASVVCFSSMPIETDFSVDFMTDGTQWAKPLKVRVDGVWGRLCSTGWDDAAASVACRELSWQYVGGKAIVFDDNDVNTGFPLPRLVGNLRCTGTEQSLRDCATLAFSETLKNCSYDGTTPGAACYKKDISFQLVGVEGSQSSGIFEMTVDGVTGALCPEQWKEAEARVACKTLGFADGVPTCMVGENYYQGTAVCGGTARIEAAIMTILKCDGSENSLFECDTTEHEWRAWDSSGCVYGNSLRSMAAVHCFNSTMEVLDVRLSPGPNYGRVEVNVSQSNIWGTVCDNMWDERDATVICRQLGYGTGKAVRGAGYGRQTPSTIWLDGVECTGNESSIGDCIHKPIGIHNCDHQEDVGVVCSEITTTTTMKTTTRFTTGTTSVKTTTIFTTGTTSVNLTTATELFSPNTTTPSVSISPSTAKTLTTPFSPISSSTSNFSPFTTSSSSTFNPSLSSTSSQNTTPVKEKEELVSSAVLLATLIPILVLLLLIVLFVAIFLVKRRQNAKKSGIHTDVSPIVHETSDGTLQMENVLYGMEEIDIRPEDFTLHDTTDNNAFENKLASDA